MSETTAASRAQTAHRMEVLVGYILQIGVLLSISLIAVGVVWRWFNTGSVGFDYSISGMNFFEFVLSDIQQMLAGNFRPRLLANLGMTTLMLTPYVRVLASMLYFALAAHNRKYTLFTGFVFVVLTYSLFLR
jgi:uncharacterized membrane protein